ncbi:MULTISPECIES: MFS transporter [Rhodomicrobium]|uniref:MFS transporter n=1 Tax=Rhodomicrobium TaxID=1068 RepID=UPI000B4AFD17|nr:MULTISPECIES: MFS transporter [Rhodomicrobium]
MQKTVHPIWWLVLAASIILAINMGIRQTFGLFLKPVTLDLGVSREAFALAIAFSNLLWGLGSPFAGALSDKYGARWVVAGGAALYTAGLVIMANSAGETGLLISGALIGLGVAGSGFTAVLGVVGRAAPPERQSLALSLTSMGSAVGQFVALPFTHVLIGDAGWIVTLAVLAVTTAVMAPLGFALGSGPNGARGAAATAPLGEQGLGAALKEALSHPSFLLLTAGFFVCGFQLAGVVVHLPAYLTDKHFDPSLGVIALTTIGLTNIAGTYVCGRAGEIMPKRVALTLIYLGRGLVFLAMLYLPLTETAVIIYAAVLGFLWLGTIPLTSGLIVTFFGPRWLSTLYGIVFVSHQIGGFLGAWLGGWVYDRYQSYDMLWWAAIAVSLMAALCNLPIRERPAPRMAGLVPAE